MVSEILIDISAGFLGDAPVPIKDVLDPDGVLTDSSHLETVEMRSPAMNNDDLVILTTVNLSPRVAIDSEFT
jgi:hypothetical protein